MSLIPLDEPRGGGPDTDRDGPEDTSLVDRVLSGLRAVLLALPGVSTLVTDADSDQSASTTELLERNASAEREAPAALPGGSAADVEVVCTETDDTLTVEAVDNPDATISSDTWEPVER